MTKTTSIKQLRLQAMDIRIDVLQALTAAKSGHSAGPLGIADVFAALYLNVANIDPQRPDWPERDRIVLSHGHVCPVLYAAMAQAGFFPREELLTLRKLGTRLQGHPHRTELPGLETTSGPLGSGLSQAAGMAYAFKMDGTKQHVWCVGSDGEQQEGNIWEGVMFAAAKKLDNLTVIIDRNYIQIEGSTEDVMPLDPLGDKYRSFNWNVMEIDGHNMEQIVWAMTEAKHIHNRPTLIIANVIPGYGVSFMADDYTWHGKPPTQEQLAKAVEEIETLKKQIERE
ncbi:MAG: transketolase [Patescibacteria group bacterium]|jgi:transketolase